MFGGLDAANDAFSDAFASASDAAAALAEAAGEAKLEISEVSVEDLHAAQERLREAVESQLMNQPQVAANYWSRSARAHLSHSLIVHRSLTNRLPQ